MLPKKTERNSAIDSFDDPALLLTTSADTITTRKNNKKKKTKVEKKNTGRSVHHIFTLMIRKLPLTGNGDSDDSSRSFVLPVQSSHKLSTVQQKIHRARGIPTCNIRLSLPSDDDDENTAAVNNPAADFFLDPQRTLKSLGIFKSCNAAILELAAISIRVRTPKGRTIVLKNSVEAECVVDELEELIVNELRKTAGRNNLEKNKHRRAAVNEIFPEGMENIGDNCCSDTAMPLQLFYDKIPLRRGRPITKYNIKHNGMVEIQRRKHGDNNKEEEERKSTGEEKASDAGGGASAVAAATSTAIATTSNDATDDSCRRGQQKKKKSLAENDKSDQAAEEDKEKSCGSGSPAAPAIPMISQQNARKKKKKKSTVLVEQPSSSTTDRDDDPDTTDNNASSSSSSSSSSFFGTTAEMINDKSTNKIDNDNERLLEGAAASEKKVFAAKKKEDGTKKNNKKKKKKKQTNKTRAAVAAATCAKEEEGVDKMTKGKGTIIVGGKAEKDSAKALTRALSTTTINANSNKRKTTKKETGALLPAMITHAGDTNKKKAEEGQEAPLSTDFAAKNETAEKNELVITEEEQNDIVKTTTVDAETGKEKEIFEKVTVEADTAKRETDTTKNNHTEIESVIAEKETMIEIQIDKNSEECDVSDVTFVLPSTKAFDGTSLKTFASELERLEEPSADENPELRLLEENDIENDTIDNGKNVGLKEEDADGSIIPSFSREGSIFITINMSNETVFELEISEEDTVAEIRQNIAAECDIPIKDLRLFFRGREVDDNVFALSNGDVLDIVMPTVTVVLQDGEELDLDVLRDTTVRDIKDALEEETGIGCPCQQLFHCCRNGELLAEDDDTTLLTECGLQSGGQIKLEEFAIGVFCCRSGDLFKLSGRINNKSSINEIKEKIAIQKSVPKEKQVLTTKDRQVLDLNFKSLVDYGIRHNDILMLENPEKKELKKRNCFFSFLSRTTDHISLNTKLQERPVGVAEQKQQGQRSSQNPTIGDCRNKDINENYRNDIQGSSLLRVSSSDNHYGSHKQKEVLSCKDDKKSLEKSTRLQEKGEVDTAKNVAISLEQPSVLSTSSPEYRSEDDEGYESKEKIVDEAASTDSCSSSHSSSFNSDNNSDYSGVYERSEYDDMDEDDGEHKNNRDIVDDTASSTDSCSSYLFSTNGNNDCDSSEFDSIYDDNEEDFIDEANTMIVIAPDLKPITIDIGSQKTIAIMDLKPKISRFTGIPIDELRIFKCNDTNDPVTDGFQPRPGDVLTVLLPTITINLPNDELLELEASPGTTIGDIKESLVEETGISKSNQKLLPLEEYYSKEWNDVDNDDVPIKEDMKFELLNVLENAPTVSKNSKVEKNVVKTEIECGSGKKEKIIDLFEGQQTIENRALGVLQRAAMI